MGPAEERAESQGPQISATATAESALSEQRIFRLGGENAIGVAT
jgi:hypothetical protein